MRTVLSIDIGSHNLHMVEGAGANGQVTVAKARTIAMPAECRKNEIIKDPSLLAETLREGIRAGGFTAREAVVTINAAHAVVKDIDLPLAKPKELEGMVRQEMHNAYHVPEDDVIQFKEIGQLKSPDGTALKRYRAVAINDDLVRSYFDSLNQAKLKPLAMDINLNAIDKLLEGNVSINDKLLGEESAMLIDFGGSSTSVYIAAKDNELFYRHLTFGSAEIEQIVSDELLARPEVIRGEKEEGISFFTGSDEGGKYYQSLRPYFYRFNDELRKIISFYNSRANGSSIGTVYLYGEGGRMAGLAEYWASNLAMDVEPLMSVSKVSRQSAVPDIAPYLNALGALLRY